MKLMIASDIHGSAYWCARMLEQYQTEGAQRLILLGDVLYHGPRNDLPRDYAPKQVIAQLDPLAAEILAVRGNCDCEVDQMVLRFPVLAEYGVLLLEDKLVYLTHGHVINREKPIPFAAGSVLLHGHTHVPACEDCGTFQYLNPGSVSIPKNGSAHSYMTYENGVFVWKDVETGTPYRQWEL